MNTTGARPTRLRLSLRALGGRMGEQWDRDRRDTLFLMGGTMLSVLPHFAFLPWWTTLSFLVLFFWRLGLVFSGRWLPRDSVRWVAALACTAAVYAHYDSLLGRDAGVTLLMLFLGLKLMEMRARRDLFVVLFLCFFMLLAGFFHSQSAFTAAVSAVAVLVLVATMVTMQFGQREAPIPMRLRTALLMIVQALPIAAALFLLFPRLEHPLWGVPEDSFSARTGLSDSMAPGRIARLGNSDEVAFRVKFAGRPPAESDMYWRGPVFGRFDGETWSQLTDLVSPFPPLQVRYEQHSPAISYAVTMEPSNRGWLFALEAPVSLGRQLAGQANMGPDMQLTGRESPGQRIRYEIESRLDFHFGLNETPATLGNWLTLPPGFNPRTLELAARWRAEESDPVALVRRAMTMFRQQPFRYTMTPPPLGRHSVDEFLFDTRAGFCEHYAGSLVVLMRALGVPARVVTGYQGAEANPDDDYYIVRQADAHAWAEVWLPQRGWQRVDPVTAVAPERIERGSRAARAMAGDDGLLAADSVARRWQLKLDTLSNAWNQWVLSYDSARQKRLIAGLGFDFGDWRDLAGMLAASLAVLIGAAALITLHPRLPKDPVERGYRTFCDRLADVGLDRVPHETAGRFLDRVGRGLDPDQYQHARLIVSLYNNLRYGQATHDPAGVQHFRSLVKSFKP